MPGDQKRRPVGLDHSICPKRFSLSPSHSPSLSSFTKISKCLFWCKIFYFWLLQTHVSAWPLSSKVERQPFFPRGTPLLVYVPVASLPDFSFWSLSPSNTLLPRIIQEKCMLSSYSPLSFLSLGSWNAKLSIK